MNCPVCKREMAATLSICVKCGAMMHDSVREELACKLVSTGEIVSGDLMPIETESNPLPLPPVVKKPVESIPSLPLKKPIQVEAVAHPLANVEKRVQTSGFAAKQTSQTLMDFQTKTTVPDWRLQVQNAVRQRNAGNQTSESPVEAVASYQNRPATTGANALKTEITEEPEKPVHNEKLANAIKRIDASRQAFLKPDPNKPIEAAAKPAVAVKNYPFNVVGGQPAKINPPAMAAPPVAKPRLVSSLRIEKRAFDTNKLPPLPEPAKIVSSFAEHPADEPDLVLDYVAESFEPILSDAEPAQIDLAENFEGDDVAPLGMRFNAGLFDLIIGGFTSLFILSPFLIKGSNWLSLFGLAIFLVVLAVVMFAYLTTAIGYVGRTFGMRVYSLELVDVAESDYPTMKQAAINSAVYLASLMTFGLGFVPMFFNDDRRTAHDLISGTILVKEY